MYVANNLMKGTSQIVKVELLLSFHSFSFFLLCSQILKWGFLILTDANFNCSQACTFREINFAELFSHIFYFLHLFWRLFGQGQLKL